MTAWRVSTTKALSLEHPRVLGIINTTPDSFSDGGVALDPAAAAEIARRMMGEGAIGVDVGGESTRPGATRVAPDEQIRRVVPAITAIRRAIGEEPVITIDTTLAPVAAAALAAGADAINDVSAGREDPGLLPLAASRSAGVILMHRLRPPGADAFSTAYGTPGAPAIPAYGDVVREVADVLARRADAAVAAGVPRDAIVLDPGLGFGKSVEQNRGLIVGTRELVKLGFPVLSALSRKSFVAKLAGLSPPVSSADLAAASATLSVLHHASGAAIFRVHDVAAHVAALKTPFNQGLNLPSSAGI